MKASRYFAMHVAACAPVPSAKSTDIFAIGLGTPNGGMRVATVLKSSILVMRIFVREQLPLLGDSKTESTPSQFENIVQDHGKHEWEIVFAIHCSGSIFIFRAFSKFVKNGFPIFFGHQLLLWNS